MRIFKVCALTIVSGLLLSSCTSDRDYPVSHEQLVEAATQAITEESRSSAGDIKVTEKEMKGGKLTVLEAKYNIYSQIKVEIDSTDKHCKCPELEVKVTTDKILWTRHKDFEERIHEIVTMKLRSKKHGDESKPTALPPGTKIAVPAPAPAPAKK